MARLFLSYAHQDSAAAQDLAAAMTERGHQVWWDRELHGGTRFATEIDRQLREADAVVVLWSRHSCESPWVQDEASEGRDSGRMVPVGLDDSRPPLGFRQYQSIDFSGFPADQSATERLERAIVALVDGASPSVATPPEQARRSICVLPFVNMSGEAEQDYFSDGISEDIITDLSKVSSLSVIARNTAFQFKGTSVDVPTIARKLRVSHILEGSVRKSGSRVRITAQLIDGAAGDHVWAERYDRDLTDIFALQDEISEAIVGALKVKLLPEEKKAIEQRCTCNAEAYDLYLLARQYWITGNHGDRRREERVIRICAKATEIDPGYARAWALMAIAQSSLRYGFNGFEGSDDGVAAARRALELDPSIAEAHCPLARSFAEAGQFDAADAEIAAALRLDPDSWEVNKEAARMFYRQRRIDEATRHFEKATEVMETDFHAWGMLFACYMAQGRKEMAVPTSQMLLKQVERVLAEDPDNGAALSLGATGLAVLGQPERAKQWIDRAILVDPDNLNMRYNFACALATSGDRDGSIAMLGPVFEACGPTILKIAEADVDLDTIRKDPRFQTMITNAKQRLGVTR
ncbi:MAG TPA: TIR domain-containing protein [Sphingomicrobium sp.]|nr:TIR domain-containing protein [Sphingomicrobium sp.]